MYEILLPVHIFAGFCSLLSACIAILTSKGQPWHVYSGRIFFGGMLVIFMTAIPMTLLRPNVFLFLVAIFSFYQALTGWRAARNRSGRPAPIDWTAAGIMTLAGVGMIVFGTSLLLSGNTMGIVMLVFGSLGGSSGVYDLRQLRHEPLTGKKRIAAHLSRMLGGTIATVTAFVVTNFQFSPAFVLWLAPSIVIVPLIIYWNRVTLSPTKRMQPMQKEAFSS